jgi:hypothetical protein
MTTVKNANYTPEMTNQIKGLYAEGKSVDFIANLVGKSTRSIVAKLSREGVYKPKEKTTKTGEPVTAKNELADKICEKANLPFEYAESIAKANKQALVGILSALNRN